MSKVMGIFVKFWLFLQCPLTKLFYFVLILHLILEKIRKFLVEKLSTSEVISRKPHGSPVPLGLANTTTEEYIRQKPQAAAYVSILFVLCEIFEDCKFVECWTGALHVQTRFRNT